MSHTGFIGKVSKKWQIADNTFAFELVGVEGAPLPRFEAGAHIDIIAAPSIVRQYSIANDPLDENRYLLGILKTANPAGVSSALCDRIDVGAHLHLNGPRNHFPLVESANHSVLVGAGIGITPMLAMAHRLERAGASFEVHFFARSRANAPFIDDIEQMAFADKVHLHLDDQGGDPRFTLQAALLDCPEDSHFYTCGPNGFIAMACELAGRIFPEGHVHKEFFEFEEKTLVNSAFEVEIKSTGQVLTVPEDRAIIDVLQENGIFVPRNCPKGVCGACARQVLEGEIDHRDQALPQAARDQGYMLLCVSRAKSERLVLDL